MIPAGDLLPILMFLTGCGLLTAILLRRSYRYFGVRARRRKNEPTIDSQPRPTDSWSGMQKDAAAHIQRQQVELYDMARDASGELDSKMRVLQHLVAQSNSQIERMEELLAELNQQRA